MKRLHIYVSHSFQHADKYARLMEFARDDDIDIADFSIPEWAQNPGPIDQVLKDIADRISRCNRVLVLITDQLYNRRFVEYEVEVAKALSKPLIGVYTHGTNGSPIPRFLDGACYRMIGWQRGSLSKALRGEYPPDTRVFDIAEEVDRRAMALRVGAVTGALTLLIAGWTYARFASVKADLQQQGISVTLDDAPSAAASILPPSLLGALTGAVVIGLLGGDRDDIIVGAGVGALTGAAVGVVRHYRAQIIHYGSVTRLDLIPAQGA